MDDDEQGARGCVSEVKGEGIACILGSERHSRAQRPLYGSQTTEMRSSLSFDACPSRRSLHCESRRDCSFRLDKGGLAVGLRSRFSTANDDPTGGGGSPLTAANHAMTDLQTTQPRAAVTHALNPMKSGAPLLLLSSLLNPRTFPSEQTQRDQHPRISHWDFQTRKSELLNSILTRWRRSSLQTALKCPFQLLCVACRSSSISAAVESNSKQRFNLILNENLFFRRHLPISVP